MDLGQENIEIFMESNKDAFITFVHKSKAAPGTGTYTILHSFLCSALLIL